MEYFASVCDFEKAALANLPKVAADYYRSGATTEQTLGENKAAFSRLRIRPKFLRDVSNIDMSTTILGEKIKIPLGIAPTAMQKLAHHEGEAASAKAAGSLGTIFILSTISTCSIEEVAEAAPNTIKWFQLYIYKNRDLTKDLIRRAEKAGFKAVVLTVDAPFFGIRRDDIRNRFSLPPHIKLGNFTVYMEQLAKVEVDSKSGSGINEYVQQLFDSTLTWDDIAWLKSITKLPIILKGILRSDDAELAVKHGVSAIIVSNHGARQVDGTPASIEALPEIVKVTKNTPVEVYMDGGVSQGTDIFKALALGAKMVFAGRPAIWGLANGGQKAVEKVLGIYKMELESCMGISGCKEIADITSDYVTHESRYSKL